MVDLLYYVHIAKYLFLETDTECNVLDTDAAEPSVIKKRVATKRKFSENVPPLKRYIKKLHENAIKREETSERRHKENLESRREALNIFSQKMDALITLMANKSKQ